MVQKALGFHQKYLNLCSEDGRRSYGFWTTWGWVINDRIFILGWTIPLNVRDLIRNCLFFSSNRVWIISGFSLKHLYSSLRNWIVSTIFSLIMSKSLIDWFIDSFIQLIDSKQLIEMSSLIHPVRSNESFRNETQCLAKQSKTLYIDNNYVRLHHIILTWT